MVRFLQETPILVKLLLKALFIMLMPLSFTLVDPLSILSLPLNGLLFTTWDYYGIIFAQYPSYLPIPSFTQILGNLGIGLLMASPGMYFDYRIHSSPANRRFLRLAIALMIFDSFLVFLVLMTINSTSYMYYLNYMLLMNILTFPTLVVCFFIILPMVQRQATLIAVPEELHTSTVGELEKIPGLRVRRERNLALVLWACLCFLPYFVLSYGYSPYSMSTFFYSFAYSFGTTNSPYLPYQYSFMSGSALMFFTLPVFGALSSIRIVYIRDIYRYLKHEIPYRRMLYIGVLGDLFPIVSLAVVNVILASTPILYYSILPIPGLVFIGLLIARFHNSVLPYGRRIWTNVDSTMWFEDKVERPPLTQTSEKPFRQTEETIAVPFRYRVSSQIRKRIHNKKPQNSRKE